MSLRKLTFLLVAMTTVGLVGVVLINITRILNNHFEQQEKNNVYLGIHQVKNAMDQQIASLDNTGNDLAKWDDTYNFMDTGDPQYINDNLQPVTFQNLNIDLLILVNDKNQIVFEAAIDKNGQFVNSSPPEIKEYILRNDPFLLDLQGESVKRGLISLTNQAMMIVSRPILKSDGTGPSRGALLLGKKVDKAILDNIEHLLSLSVQIFPIVSVQTDDEFKKALAYEPTVKNPYFVDILPREVYGYALINDIFNQPTFLLRINQFPTIYNNGILVNNYLVISVVMISITFCTILFLLIEFYVLKRIRQLSNDVQAIGVSGDINLRLLVNRKDEISSLAYKINDMLVALKRADSQRRESEDRFRTLVESMEDVVFTTDRDSQKVHVYEKKSSSESAAPSEKLPGQTNILQADLENELLKQKELVYRSFQGESTIIEWSTRTDHTDRNYITTLSPIYNSDKQIISVVGVSKDITRLKILEQELRNRLNELGALFSISQQLLSEIEEESIHEIICRLAVEQLGMDDAWIGVASPDGSTLNPVASQVLKLESLNEVELNPGSGKSLHPAAAAYNQKELKFFLYDLPDRDTRLSDSDHSTAVAIPLIQSGMPLAVLVLIKRSEPYIHSDSLPLIHAFVNLSGVAMQNAFLFKQVLKGRERLQSISMRLVEVQEEERREIALELHDEVGQILTGLRLSVDMIDSLPMEKIKTQVLLSVEIINDLIARVRQMSLNLRPSMLDDLGIVPTLFWYFDRYTSQTGIQVIFQHNNLLGQRYSPSIEITVFRVIQEALTNVARYASVQSANVRLWSTEKIIGLQIEDEGVGFDQDRVFNSHDTKGLQGMRERVGFLRGQLQIITQPGEGTCLTVEIPLKGNLERRQRDRTSSIGG